MISSDSSASGVSSSIASSPVAPKKGHRKVSSLTFEDSGKDRGRPGAKERVQKETPENEEARRRERRRSEAKAAVELGNIVNGRGPMIADDDDEDAPLIRA
ncbi:hypothetical protein QCA50_002405 [Cerrena zonata]|uniref:Uncharacterized protein n=1 Tax=Cerrena zonata TaxID=2478898 RepID=A0AAW0GYW6_9APHY